MRKVVLATRNPGKVAEFGALLAPLGITVVALGDYEGAPEMREDGATFAENAIKKARTAAAFTREVALADDSGLEVDALGGRPGVFSARFAGRPGDDAANNAKLLRLLQGVPWERRTARFRCVIAIATPGGEVFTAEGTCKGYIGFAPRGEGGFGYDPLFYVPDYGKTFAELDMETKNRISHRGRALEEARAILERLFG
ncbi:MAG: XTP/dITP diphosphatase [Bacillota bacterium]